jgi:hypothetical protein
LDEHHVGIDTVRLSSCVPARSWYSDAPKLGFERLAGKSGYHGMVYYSWWQDRATGVKLQLKGCGYDGWLSYEGSVPKQLGLAHLACADDVREWGYALGRWTRGYLNGEAEGARVARVDSACDVLDVEGRLRNAARGWKPKGRGARAWKCDEAVYNDGETVELFNKTRRIRVYDKAEESGLAVQEGFTRIEYQVRHEWAARLGLADIRVLLDDCVEGAVMPYVKELRERARDESKG